MKETWRVNLECLICEWEFKKKNRGNRREEIIPQPKDVVFHI